MMLQTKPPPAGTDGGWGKTGGLPGALTRIWMVASPQRLVNFRRGKDGPENGFFKKYY